MKRKDKRLTPAESAAANQQAAAFCDAYNAVGAEIRQNEGRAFAALRERLEREIEAEREKK